MFVPIMTTAIIFLAFIMTLCPSAHSRSGFHCGKEFRIETQDGITFQGRLLLNNGNVGKCVSRQTQNRNRYFNRYACRHRSSIHIGIGNRCIWV